MESIKGHFDGSAIVLDEPASLVVGQVVRVVVESQADLAERTDNALKSTRDAFLTSGMSDEELADWLEVETHAMRGVSYPPE